MSDSRADLLPEGLQPQEGRGRPVLAQSYHSQVVDRLKELGYSARAGERDGSSWPASSASATASTARSSTPTRPARSSPTGGSSSPGEIIHNPEVNGRIEALGIRILPDHHSPEERYADVDAADVVILPAFGVSVAELQHLRVEGLRPRRHHLRQRAERLEERPPLRARRLHLGHPRQALPRGDEGHRLAGAHPRRRALPLREGPATRPSWCATSSAARCPRRRSSSGSREATSPGFDPDARPAADRPRQPDDHADDREPGDPGDAPRGHARSLGRGRARRRASAPSTRSAPPPRTARTRC